MKTLTTLIGAAVIAVAPAFAEEGHHDAKEDAKVGTVTGEVIDMACYLDHKASGAKHADCAKDCIEKGLPVGLKGNDGKTYLVIGDHKPLNQQLAPLAAKTITVRGKIVSHDGFNMIENAEIVTKESK